MSIRSEDIAKGEKVMDILQTLQQRNILLYTHASNRHRETSRSSFVMTTISNIRA